MKHTHDAIVHAHEHSHVVHYLRHGTQWEHMAATHSHEHNHPALEHDHEPHGNAEAEHLRQAHIHDHAHPASSDHRPGNLARPACGPFRQVSEGRARGHAASPRPGPG